MIRKQMIRLAFYTTDSGLRSELLRILVAESEPAKWDVFLRSRYDSGKKKVPNTNPKTKDRYPQVTMLTLYKSDDSFRKKVQDEYHAWNDATKGYHVYVSPLDKERVDGMLKQWGVTLNEEATVHLMGQGYTYDTRMSSTMRAGWQAVYMESNGLGRSLSRSIYRENGALVLYMHHMRLKPSDPKGTGTRMFASSVFQAQKMGIRQIQCDAFRDRSKPSWVGYKVWPKMGYDGVIPLEKYGHTHRAGFYCPPLPEKLEHSLEEAGFKRPYKVSHLYLVEGGQEWWEKNGESFHAEFDTTPGSQSMQVFEAYLKKCMERDGVTDLNEWLQGGSK